MLLCPLSSYADVTFDDATAGKIVMALEQAKITEQQLANKVDGNAELQKQLDILKGTIKLYEDQIAAYKNMAEMAKSISDMKDKACQEQVKAATPTFWDNMSKYLVGAAGGAGVFGIILLAL